MERKGDRFNGWSERQTGDGWREGETGS